MAKAVLNLIRDPMYDAIKFEGESPEASAIRNGTAYWAGASATQDIDGRDPSYVVPIGAKLVPKGVEVYVGKGKWEKWKPEEDLDPENAIFVNTSNDAVEICKCLRKLKGDKCRTCGTKRGEGIRVPSGGTFVGRASYGVGRSSQRAIGTMEWPTPPNFYVAASTDYVDPMALTWRTRPVPDKPPPKKKPKTLSPLEASKVQRKLLY